MGTAARRSLGDAVRHAALLAFAVPIIVDGTVTDLRASRSIG